MTQPLTTGELVARLAPSWKADELLSIIGSTLRKMGATDSADILSREIVANNALKREAADALTTLERELEAARAKIERQATEIQRMARKIKNQRGMARTTWQIVEDRAHWTRGILNRNKYLDFCTAERGRRLASQAEVERLKEALRQARIWHESEDKALSKQPPSHGPNGNQWARLQHREQMDEIDAALQVEERKT